MNTLRKREAGMDLVKILACLGVVALHTLQVGKGPVNMAVVTLSALCIPLFFMVSGYLMLKKEILDYRYALRKIATILVVCLCWEALHAAAHFAVYREIRPFVESWVLDFFQKGLFYHFWYMGALVIVYLVMPLMDRLWRRSEPAYRNVLLALVLLNAAVDAAAFLAGETCILQLPQSLRIHYWLLYAMLGGWFARNPNWMERHKSWRLAASICLLFVFLRILVVKTFGGMNIEAFYGAVPVQWAAAAVFAAFCGMACSERMGKRLAFLASLTMGIYIMHPFVLAVLNKFVPAFTEGGAAMNLLFWVVTTAVCAAGTMVLQRIPVMNRLLKL